MANNKWWVGALLGWFVAGPFGAVIGGYIAYKYTNKDEASDHLFGYDKSEQPQVDQANRNSFLMSMLVLMSFIIRADGKIMHSEMEIVRQWLRNNFGEASVTEGNEILRKLFEEAQSMGEPVYRRNIREVCHQVASHMDYSSRLQLLDFLVTIAKADGVVDGTEVEALKDLARWMDMSTSEVDAMLYRGKDDLESAYKVLGVTPDITDEELKKVYRKLALENHPDRVAALGEDIRQAAEKKFQEINAAKERVWKARGL